jgi:hypothetical protein
MGRHRRANRQHQPADLQQTHAAQAKIDELRDIRIPSEDTEAPDLGPAWKVFPSRDRGPIVQPAQPGIIPATEIRRADARTAAAVPEAENA